MSGTGFFEAYESAWVPLANAASVLDLLARLEPTGALHDLREPRAAAYVAERAGIGAETAEAVLRALELSGVVAQTAGAAQGGQHYVLTDGWAALADPGAFVPLGSALAGQATTGRVLRALGRLDYWQLPTEDRLALARAVSPDPYSDDLVAAYRRALEAEPVGRAILEGGRFLELGCGVAGRILLTLRAAPRLRAVGVELSEDLAAEAVRRAEDLGVADRFTVVCADAADFVAEEPFDFGFWSQFFFPDHARGPALAAMFAALRPGSAVTAPVGTDPAAVERSVEAAKEDALMRTMLRSWGVPERTAEGLREELERAGFAGVEVVARDAGPAVRGWKPA
jgi:SAM-dependent methyltransferase